MNEFLYYTTFGIGALIALVNCWLSFRAFIPYYAQKVFVSGIPLVGQILLFISLFLGSPEEQTPFMATTVMLILVDMGGIHVFGFAFLKHGFDDFKTMAKIHCLKCDEPFGVKVFVFSRTITIWEDSDKTPDGVKAGHRYKELQCSKCKAHHRMRASLNNLELK